MTEEPRKLNRRQFLQSSTIVAAALVAGAATGSTGPAGSSANIGPGTTNKLAKFLSTNTIGDSALSDDGTNVSSSESFLPTSDNALNFGSASLRWSTVNAVGIGNPGGGLNLTVNSTLIPVSNNTKDLGSAALLWRFLYAGEISSGSGVLQIDSGGDLIANVNSGTLGNALRPTSTGDGNTNLGLANRRWRNLFLSGTMGVFAASNDANPTARVQSSEVDFGPGGATAIDSYLKRIDANNLEYKSGAALRPNADATIDLGTTSLRPRDLYASRRVIIATKNALVLDGQTMTQTSHTVNNADTDITTYSLGANAYTRVIVRVTGYVSFVTLSTNQVINLKLKDGSTQVGNTMVVDGAISATASIPFTLEAAFVETSAATIHITEGAAAADANTTVFVNSIVVFAES